MAFSYKIDFEQMEWETPIAGVRHKYMDQDGQRIRLVEYSDEMPPHCSQSASYRFREFARTWLRFRPEIRLKWRRFPVISCKL